MQRSWIRGKSRKKRRGKRRSRERRKRRRKRRKKCTGKLAAGRLKEKTNRISSMKKGDNFSNHLGYHE